MRLFTFYRSILMSALVLTGCAETTLSWQSPAAPPRVVYRDYNEIQLAGDRAFDRIAELRVTRGSIERGSATVYVCTHELELRPFLYLSYTSETADSVRKI